MSVLSVRDINQFVVKLEETFQTATPCTQYCDLALCVSVFSASVDERVSVECAVPCILHNLPEYLVHTSDSSDHRTYRSRHQPRPYHRDHVMHALYAHHQLLCECSVHT